MIKNLLFDMGGVIFNQNSEEAFRRFAEIGIDPDKYMGRFGQKDFFLDVENGNIDDLQFCQRLSETIGRDVSWEEAQHCWLGFVDYCPEKRLRDLETLRQRGYHLCLLSNTNPFIMAYTRSQAFSDEQRPITDFFDSFFCSYEMKVCKPNAEIFLKALAMDDMKADECLFIDDSEKNTKAAEALGIHTLLTKTNEDWMNKLEEILTSSE